MVTMSDPKVEQKKQPHFSEIGLAGPIRGHQSWTMQTSEAGSTSALSLTQIDKFQHLT